METYENGNAHTLGNALRRVLLSSMVGFAPTEAQIAGVVHEYSQIDGVKEDVVDILLNVKGIIFKLENRDEVTITLRKEGEGVVTAADFDLPHDVQILNPEHVIANLSGGKLDMQLKIETGRGYQPGDMRALKDDYSKGTIGRIIMDASFSPILRVAYRVENARVEQRTDLDKLVMNIETNGAILPEEALRQAAHILQDQLSVFFVCFFQKIIVDLCFVFTILLQVLVINTCFLCNLGNWLHCALLCNFDVTFESHNVLLSPLQPSASFIP